MSQRTRSNLILFTTAFVWGLGYVAQRAGADYVDGFTYNTCRSIISCLCMLVFFGCRRAAGKAPVLTEEEKTAERRVMLTSGVLIGAVVFCGMALQQNAMPFTTAGKASFITSLNVVFVPIIGLFIGRKPRNVVWLCVVLAVIGFWFLSVKEGMSIGIGELMMLGSAVTAAVQILLVDRFAPKLDGSKLAFMQFVVMGFLSAVCMFLFEHPTLAAIKAGFWAIAYAGVFSGFVAFNLQIVGQRHADPSVAGLIMSSQTAISIICGAIILGEVLSTRDWIGCAFMLAAIVIAQLPEKKPAGEDAGA